MEALEIAGRVTVVWVALFVMLRLAGRREFAELTPMDMLTMLLVSETVSPALTGDNHTVWGGLEAAGVLLALTVVLSLAQTRSRRLERLAEGAAQVLIDDGHVHTDVMRDHRITDAQLTTALHQEGLLEASQVKRAFIEPSGAISIIKNDDA